MDSQPVLFIHHANDMYGADFGLLHTIRSLDPAKYYPIVILPADMPEGKLSDELNRLGVEYHFAPLGILRRKYFTRRHILPLLRDILRGIFFVRAVARKRRIVLAYVNTFVPISGAIGVRLAGVPVLWHIREILTVGRGYRRVLLSLLNLCATKVICISQAVRNSLVAEAPSLQGKCVLLYNAVEPKGSVVHDLQLRDELGIPREACLIGMVGRISHWKGQEVLARAAAIVLRERADVQFLVVGSYFADESYYLRTLEKLIDSLGISPQFHITDYRSNVVEVYRALDIFVLASTKPEPFGRVTVEAMMEGLPVVATRHGASPEILQEGVTGMLVTPSDPQALAEALIQLIREPETRERIGRSAAVHAKAHYGLESYTAQMRTLMDSVARSTSH